MAGRIGRASLRRVAGALCVVLLLVAPLWPAAADEAKPLTAILLVARAELPDPDFADSVVLVMNHLADAPVGVIVNRPTEIRVAELFPDIKRLANLPDKLYFGGPVDFGTVWFLFRAVKPPANAVAAFDGVYLSGDRDLLRKLLSRTKPMEGLRIFVGHSGWAPSQLEAEISHGDWTLRRVESDAIFGHDAERPWPVLPEPGTST